MSHWFWLRRVLFGVLYVLALYALSTYIAWGVKP